MNGERWHPCKVGDPAERVDRTPGNLPPIRQNVRVARYLSSLILIETSYYTIEKPNDLEWTWKKSSLFKMTELNEKAPLMQRKASTTRTSDSPSTPPRRSGWSRLWLGLTLLLLLRLCWTMSFMSAYFPLSSHHSHHGSNAFKDAADKQCRQADPLFPSQSSAALDAMDEFLTSPQFFNASVGRLAGAVQIPSESFDGMGPVGEDSRWDVMYDLALYLERTFPLVHSTLKLEKVNTHALLYTWQGSDASLKPTVLMAHQDTVPVEKSTIGQWTHPPFSGEFDGRFVWGRGASDCKNSLVGILEAVELLVEAGFSPKRTLVLSFGFDEESAGVQGAGSLAEAILDRYGKDSVEIIVDEGSGLMKQWGTVFALPAVAEKGYIDVDVIVKMPGGHSSIPPKHNGIGVMGELITAIEANLYEPHLHSENPFLGALYCGAAHAAEFPPSLKKELRHRGSKDVESCDKKDKLALEVSPVSLVAVRNDSFILLREIFQTQKDPLPSDSHQNRY